MESQSLRVGDEILITGPTTGAIETIVTEIRVAELPVEEALKGQSISMPLEEKIRPSDKLYKVISSINE